MKSHGGTEVCDPAHHIPMGQPCRLHLVGDRTYVRGLELVSLFRKWLPLATLDFGFLRPMTCEVAIGRERPPRFSTVVTVLDREDRKERYFISNLDTGRSWHIPEPPAPPHLVVWSSRTRQAFLVVGSHDDAAKLGIVFQLYQTTAGQRFILTKLRLNPSRALPFELIVLRAENRSENGSFGSLQKNLHSWCELEWKRR